MMIVHISDTHVSEPHPSSFFSDLAEKVIEKINEIGPEIVVVTGDLTENGSSSEFMRAKSYTDRIKCRNKIVIPGNHDARNVGYLCFEEIFGPRSRVERYEGVTIVGVDSTEPDLDEGHIGRDKYGWIEQCLDTDDFKVFALHHHLIPVPLTGRERNILIDAGDVLKLLIQCGTDLVLCGHKHVPWIWNLNGTIITNTGTACANRVKWNIPQSFSLIEIDEDKKGTIKIHRMYSKGGQELILEENRTERMKCLP